MATITLQATASIIDAMVYSDAATTNYGINVLITSGATGGGMSVGRTLIKFDLSSIPPNAIVSSAILSIRAIADYSSNADTVSVYRVKRVWTEAGVTWNKYDGTNNWGTAGCDNTTSDRDSSATGTINLTATETLNVFKDITLTAANVQQMISGAYTNNGFLIRNNTENQTNAYNYNSSENGTEGYNPKLVITYTLAGGGFLANFT